MNDSEGRDVLESVSFEDERRLASMQSWSGEDVVRVRRGSFFARVRWWLGKFFLGLSDALQDKLPAASMTTRRVAEVSDLAFMALASVILGLPFPALKTRERGREPAEDWPEEDDALSAGEATFVTLPEDRVVRDYPRGLLRMARAGAAFEFLIDSGTGVVTSVSLKRADFEERGVQIPQWLEKAESIVTVVARHQAKYLRSGHLKDLRPLTQKQVALEAFGDEGLHWEVDRRSGETFVRLPHHPRPVLLNELIPGRGVGKPPSVTRLYVFKMIQAVPGWRELPGVELARACMEGMARDGVSVVLEPRLLVKYREVI